LDEYDRRGNRIVDDVLLLLFNAHHEAVPFRLPTRPSRRSWLVVFDTARDAGLRSLGKFRAGTRYPLEGRSVVMLLQRRNREP
jgi:glycogen operon protein